MAFESVFWRSKIKREISFIKKKMDINMREIEDENRFESIFSHIEIKLFIIAYSLRKLMDTYKFPDDVPKKKIKLLKFEKKDKKRKIKPLTLPETYYNFDKEIKTEITLRNICNQFIHTFYFQLLVNSRGKIWVIEFVSKDYKDKYIYRIKLSYFLEQVLSIVDKEMKAMTIWRDDDEKDGYRIECF